MLPFMIYFFQKFILSKAVKYAMNVGMLKSEVPFYNFFIGKKWPFYLCWMLHSVSKITPGRYFFLRYNYSPPATNTSLVFQKVFSGNIKHCLEKILCKVYWEYDNELRQYGLILVVQIGWMLLRKLYSVRYFQIKLLVCICVCPHNWSGKNSMH